MHLLSFIAFKAFRTNGEYCEGTSRHSGDFTHGCLHSQAPTQTASKYRGQATEGVDYFGAILTPHVYKLLITTVCYSDCAHLLREEVEIMSYGSQNKAVIKNADMAEDMQQRVVDCAQDAMNRYTVEKDIAAHIKKEFDKMYGPTWHCIVGRNFGR